MAQTKADGSVEGAWEPDSYGKYDGKPQLSGSSAYPELGLSGRPNDPASDLYYFLGRWFDHDRGRFMSISPFPSIIEQPYAFLEGQTLDHVDPTGFKMSPAECGILLGDIIRKGGLLLYELQKYDPVGDAIGGYPMKGGGKTKPNGHLEEIENLKRGIKNDLSRFVRNCLNNDDNYPKFPRDIDRLANRRPIPITVPSNRRPVEDRCFCDRHPGVCVGGLALGGSLIIIGTAGWGTPIVGAIGGYLSGAGSAGVGAAVLAGE